MTSVLFELTAMVSSEYRELSLSLSVSVSSNSRFRIYSYVAVCEPCNYKAPVVSYQFRMRRSVFNSLVSFKGQMSQNFEIFGFLFNLLIKG